MRAPVPKASNYAGHPSQRATRHPSGLSLTNDLSAPGGTRGTKARGKGDDQAMDNSSKVDVNNSLVPPRPGSYSLRCPKCAELKLPHENAAFCTLDCFRVAWSSHKSIHPKPGALASQQSPEGWKYYVRKGRGRALELPRFDWTGPLRPYPISKMRVVPDEIEKPDWALDGIPKIEPDSDLQKRVEIKTPELIERMRETCRIAREVLDAAARVIKPGITTDEIDRVVHEETIARGGYPSPLNYHFFPRSCCTSVNEVICHGIPDARSYLNLHIKLIFHLSSDNDLSNAFLERCFGHC
ncbi:unnamed protein product [Miscanthus lutarioriparius]|uniref:Methionine aminopeptidase n=1 Tax=Miscanthus lutarioriparius TaxID=422564 RepID=A0A811Q713_9POAL|nr:unnamed protein product [Miscanthus lutarioriparius]